MGFRRGTEDAEAPEVKIEQVRRRVDAPQCPVKSEVVSFVTLDEPAGKYDLEYISPQAMGNSLADIRLVFFVGQGTGGFAYGTEGIRGIVAVVDRLFDFLDVARFSVSLKFHKYHLAFEIIEHDQILVEDVEDFGRIVLRVAAVFHRNLFKVADSIECRVSVDTAVTGVFAFHAEAPEEFPEGIFHPEFCTQGFLFAAFVGKHGGYGSVIDREACNGVQTDERTVVFHSVVVGTFQQDALRKQVAHLQVRADGSVQVAGQYLVAGGISKCFHC